MKPYSYFFFLVCLTSFFTSCSEDSEEMPDDEIAAVDLLIGTWDYVSEHNYDCETNEILIERFIPDDLDTSFVFNEDGTFVERDEPNSPGGAIFTGTWERISETTYKFNYLTPEAYSYESDIDEGLFFENDDILFFDILGCNEEMPDNYDAIRYERRN